MRLTGRVDERTEAPFEKYREVRHHPATPRQIHKAVTRPTRRNLSGAPQKNPALNLCPRPPSTRRFK
jgi:hypothetical protein